jgi:hypothetical protein
MSHYETTVRLTHISTSSKARSGLSVADAVGAAKAHLRYITRDDAAQPGDVLARSNGAILDGSPDDLKAAAKAAIDNRSQRHTDAHGVRLADKLIVSLPRDATMDEQRTMCAAILSDFCGDSEAFGMAAIHTDKRGNPHAHFLFVDGLESIEAAKARRPDAQRVRRADALRLNEGGNRQEVRERVAASINATAAPAGRRMAEVRSLEARGIDRTPQRHEGPQVADRLARHPDRPTFTRRVYNRLKSNADALRKRLQRDTIEGASIDPDDIPSRYRKGWIGTALRDWRQRVSAHRTRGQDRTSGQMVEDGAAAFVADWAEQEPPSPTLPPLVANPTPPAGPTVRDPERRAQAIQAAKEAARVRTPADFHEFADPPGSSRQGERPRGRDRGDER